MKKQFLLALSVGALCAMRVCATDAEEDVGRPNTSANPYHDPEFLKNRYMKPRPNNKPSSGASLEALERKAAESNVRDEEPLSKATSPKARAQTSTKEVM